MKVKILECKSGVSKKGNAYNIALIQTDDGVGKVFSDLPFKKNEEVDVDIKLQANQEMFLSPRIVGLSRTTK